MAPERRWRILCESICERDANGKRKGEEWVRCQSPVEDRQMLHHAPRYLHQVSLAEISRPARDSFPRGHLLPETQRVLVSEARLLVRLASGNSAGEDETLEAGSKS